MSAKKQANPYTPKKEISYKGFDFVISFENLITLEFERKIKARAEAAEESGDTELIIANRELWQYIAQAAADVGALNVEPAQVAGMGPGLIEYLANEISAAYQEAVEGVLPPH